MQRDLPNVLVYLIDTLRADHLSAYGYHRETSPHLEQLAADGVRFERASSQAPWTRPSVASLFTSMLTTYHGASTDSGLAPELSTLAELFRDAGYDTAAIVSNAHVHAPTLNFEQGFAHFEETAPDAPAGEVHRHVYSWLERRHPGPFCLYVHTLDPHSPYDPPEETAGAYRSAADLAAPKLTGEQIEKRTADGTLDLDDLRRIIDRYDEEILYADREFGRLVERLRELGLYEDTIIVVLSDHGEEFLEHGKIGHGSHLWEELLHVPLIVKLAGADRPRGAEVAEPVRVIDVLPTLADLVGLRIGARQGDVAGAAAARGDSSSRWTSSPNACRGCARCSATRRS